MNQQRGGIGRTNADTAKTLLQGLDEHNVPHDESPLRETVVRARWLLFRS